uniref:Putative thiol-disulfide isomerase and thioredoxins. putative cytochrome C biogenesis protein n=1 Tax=Magnetococcus massalia (strain MO-1) TaxID=451514 RepID=A0A1S7LP83_MAGMO|nr:Putative thiol-disulfide isomerase and thioredoxins. putative cytochrome C biogenesis protein [Candidatus Magnetococcus massalia]
MSSLLLVGCDALPPLKNGDPAPHFSLQDLDGKQLSYPADFKGQAVVVRFWADWCPHCREEMQQLDGIYNDLQAKGLTMLALNVSQDREVAAAFIQDIGVSYGSLLDRDGSVAERYRVLGLPTTYFMGRDGRIHSKILGESDLPTFTRMAHAVLAKKGN